MAQLIHQNPDVYLVSVPYLIAAPSSSTNCFVIVDSDEALMIDTGAPTEEAYSEVIRALRDELGLEPSRVRYFLTHLHLDHSGLIKRLADENTVVYVSEEEHRYALGFLCEEGIRAYEAEMLAEGLPEEHLPELTKVLFDQTGPATFKDPRFRIEYVSEGDVVEVGKHRFEVLSTPGHSTGHVSLFHREAALLFNGDHVLFHMNPSVIFTPGDGDALGAYYESLAKLEGLDVRHAFVSHDQLEGPLKERIGQIRKHHEARVEKALEALSAHPGMRAFDVTEELAWSGIDEGGWSKAHAVLRWCTFAQTLAVLRHLVSTGKAERLIDSGGTPRYRLTDPLP